MQVSSESLYLTDDSNRVLFPDENGVFAVNQLSMANHYEVHGDAMGDVARTPSTSSEPHTSSASSPVFAFAQRQSPAALTGGTVQFRKQIPKTFQR